MGPQLYDFDEIVRRHWRPIFSYVLASVRDRGVAEDLTQDCFWRAYKGWPCFRGDSSVDTWLRHIAVNVVKNFARSKRLHSGSKLFCRIRRVSMSASRL